MALAEPEKAFCVNEFVRAESVVSLQREIRTKYCKDPTFYNIIMKWYRTFEEDGCLCDGKQLEPPGVLEEKVEQVRNAHQHSPSKFTRRANQDLNIAQGIESPSQKLESEVVMIFVSSYTR